MHRLLKEETKYKYVYKLVIPLQLDSISIHISFVAEPNLSLFHYDNTSKINIIIKFQT